MKFNKIINLYYIFMGILIILLLIWYLSSGNIDLFINESSYIKPITNKIELNITKYLSECVNNNIPVSFSKYGDGEFFCAFGAFDYNNNKKENCDNDSYTLKLSESLKHSFKYMVETANNAYIGLWHNYEYKSKWDSLITKPVKWADYYTIIFHKHIVTDIVNNNDDNNNNDNDNNDNNNDDNNNDKVLLYKSIKKSKLKKIIICNQLLEKSKILLDIDYIVNVPINNWFDTNFESILENVKQIIKDDGNHIVITCCGMSAKVLICELTKTFPKGIYLDFGSALDLICTKKDSRGYTYSYDYTKNLLKDIIPEDWDNNKYNSIYNNANKKLGLHM